MTTPLTIYGAPTCEDTALVRERLRTLGVPFSEIDVTQDPAAGRLVEEINRGFRITPTLMLAGDHQPPLAEPTLQQLQDWLSAAGIAWTAPTALQYHGALADRPLPDFALPDANGAIFRLSTLRGRQKTTIFFAHAHDCLVCAGFARQLAHTDAASTAQGPSTAPPRRPYADTNASLINILPGDSAGAHAWAHEFAGGQRTLADADGAVKQRIADYIGADPTGVFVLLLDRYTAPRVRSLAADAGGLLAPHEIAEWLYYLDHECAE